MREIRFRGRMLDGGRWIDGSLLTWPDGEAYILYDRDFATTGTMGKDPVMAATVGQYTGLKDRNGRDICEGDIVECVSWNEYFTNPSTGEVMRPFRRKMYVAFRKGGFKMVEPMPDPMKDNEWDIICNGDVEVIGNVHDNPELMRKC